MQHILGASHQCTFFATTMKKYGTRQTQSILPNCKSKCCLVQFGGQLCLCTCECSCVVCYVNISYYGSSQRTFRTTSYTVRMQSYTYLLLRLENAINHSKSITDTLKHFSILLNWIRIMSSILNTTAFINSKKLLRSLLWFPYYSCYFLKQIP